jgi:hypothetical protein
MNSFGNGPIVYLQETTPIIPVLPRVIDFNWVPSVGIPFHNIIGRGFGVAYNDSSGLWIAVGQDGSNNGNTILYSNNPDIGWIQCTTPLFTNGDNGDGIGYSVAYNDEYGLWVAVGIDGTPNGNNILYSYDPTATFNAWTPCVGTPFNDLGYGSSVAFNNSTGLWITVGQNGLGNGDNILYSYDPTATTNAWVACSAMPFGVAGYGNGVAYNDASGLWIAIGYDGDGNGNNILYSYDPTAVSNAWTVCSSTPFGSVPSGYGNSVAYNDASGLWIAVGRDESINANHILYSYDPTAVSDAWLPCPGTSFSSTGNAYGVIYNDVSGLWIAVGYDGNNILYSYDPVNIGWLPFTNSFFSITGHNVAYNPTSGLMVAVGFDESGNNILYSTQSPLAPIDFSGNDISYNSITLSWKEPNYVGNPPFTNYILTIDSSSNVLSSNDTSYTFDNLIEDTTYNFELYAVNSLGNGQSVYLQETTPILFIQPSVPIDFSYNDISFNSISLLWAPPSNVGVPPFFEYVLEISTAGSDTSAYTLDTNLNSYIINNLLDGTNYNCRLRANNTFQNGPDAYFAVTTSINDSPDVPPRFNWAPCINTPFNIGLGYSVAYNNVSGLWIAVGEDGTGNNILYSENPDISGWLPCPGTPFGINGGAYGIAYNDASGLWVAVGMNGDNNGQNILYSYDPINTNWTPCEGNPFGTTGFGNNVIYNNISGLWVVVGKEGLGNNILYSYDPTATSNTWTPCFGSPFSAGGMANGIAYDNISGLWIAVGDGNGTTKNILYSYDPTTSDPTPAWIESTDTPFASGFGNSVAYNDASGLWITVGYGTTGNCILYSYDPVTLGWTPCPNNPFATSGGNALGIIYSNTANLWITTGRDATGNVNNIAYSRNPDSNDWISFINAPFNNDNGFGYTIAYNDISNLWIVVGKDGTNSGNNILYSTLKPSAPRDFSGNDISYNNITLSWLAPVYLGFPTFSNYNLTINSSPSDISSYTLLSDMNSYTFDNLLPDTSYNFELYALNDNGNGLNVNLQRTTIAQIPASAPNNFIANDISYTFINVSWDPPSDVGNPPFTNYILIITSPNSDISSYTVDSTFISYTFDNLLSGSTYNLELYAFNSLGNGLSAYSQATTLVDNDPFGPPRFGWVPFIGKPFGDTGTANGIVYNSVASLWIAVGNDESGNNILYSNDPVSYGWLPSIDTPFTTGGTCNNIIYNDISGLWIAVGANPEPGNNILYSYDPAATSNAWVVSTGNPFNNDGTGYGVAYDRISGLSIAVGYDASGENILYSYDPVTTSWAICSGTLFGNNGTGYGVAYNDASGLWIAVGYDATGSGNTILYSNDPVATGWTPCPGSPFGGYGTGRGVVYNDASGLWIAVGQNSLSNGDNILYSYDPVILGWTPCPGSSAQGSVNSVAYNDASGLWIAVGFDGTNDRNNILYSYNPDISGWTPFDNRLPNINDNGKGIAYNNISNLWIIVGRDSNGNGNNMLYSTLKPSAPNNFSTTDISYNNITFSWNLPSYLGFPSFTDYFLVIDNAQSSLYYSVTSNINSYTVNNLVPGMTYMCIFYAENSNGNGPSVNLLASTLTPISPSVPINLLANDISYNTISLSWEPPSDIGTPPFTNYILTIDSSNEDLSSYTLGSDITSYTFDNLQQDTSYNFHLNAKNDFINGPDAYLQVNTPAIIYDPNEPLVPGQSSYSILINGQIIKFIPINTFSTQDASSGTIILLNDSIYYDNLTLAYYVNNDISGESFLITSAITSLTDGINNILITTSDDGTTITQKGLLQTLDGTTDMILNDSNSEFIINTSSLTANANTIALVTFKTPISSDLSNGIYGNFYFKLINTTNNSFVTSGFNLPFFYSSSNIKASTETLSILKFDTVSNSYIFVSNATLQNNLFSFDLSGNSSYTINQQVPDPPTALNVYQTGNHVFTSFTAPTFIGAGPIIRYIVTYSQGGTSKTKVTTTSPVMIPSLTIGASYTFSVVAVNSFGSSSKTPDSSPFIPTGSGTITGDPHITTIYGHSYFLPNVNGRFLLFNNKKLDPSLFITADCYFLTHEELQKAQFTSKYLTDYTFMRTVNIKFKNQNIQINMNTLDVICKNSSDIIIGKIVSDKLAIGKFYSQNRRKELGLSLRFNGISRKLKLIHNNITYTIKIAVDLGCADHRNDINIEGPDMDSGYGAIISPNHILKITNL